MTGMRYRIPFRRVAIVRSDKGPIQVADVREYKSDDFGFDIELVYRPTLSPELRKLIETKPEVMNIVAIPMPPVNFLLIP